MEKIKQAIEKARQQGGEKAELQRPAAVSPAPTFEISEISYSQTRIVKLNPRHLEKHRIVALNKSDLSSVSFDLLRTQVLQKMEEHGWRTLAIVSPVPECGKTVVAINLAISIAHHTNKTAMLVDFDLRKPKVSEYLGLPDGPSLNEVLEGEADASEAFVNPGMPKLVVMPVARPIQKSAEMLASTKVKNLIQDLRDRYKERIVIFDLPPLLNVDDAIAVLPQIDCVLMIVGNGMVTKHDMDESLRHLHTTHLLGVVLNKAEAQQRNNYY
jgi:Mrp family chromosome partitioning ATPase